MNICISFLSFGKNAFGGIENAVYNLSKGAISNGDSITVYTGNLSGNDSNSEGINIYRSSYLPASLPVGTVAADEYIRSELLKNSEVITRELADLIDKNEINLVVAVDPLWGIIQVTKAWKQISCPIILSLHVKNEQSLLFEAQRTPYTAVVYVSDELKRVVDEIAIFDKSYIIPNSIDIDFFKPELNVGRLSKTLFCNSRVAPGKGVDTLVRAFEKILIKYPDYKLLLCGGQSPFGDGDSSLETLVHYIELHDLDRYINILPYIPWDQIPQITRTSFAVILPTFYETFGRAALETLACGVPLIVSKVGNIPNLVLDQALLVSPGNDKEISQAFFSLVEDESLYWSLVNNGPKVASRYDNKQVAKELTNIIK